MSKTLLSKSFAGVVSAVAVWLACANISMAQVTATPEAAAQVKVGMSVQQLEAVLGRPATDVTYSWSGQRLLTYLVPGGQQVLEISMGPNSTVQLVRLSDALLP